MGRSHQRLSVDLKQANASLNALGALSGMPKRHAKVTRALVHASAPIHKTQSLDIVKIFEAIGDLPNLNDVTIDLGYMTVMPLRGLLALLDGQAKLASLQLTNLQFEGDTFELQQLRLLLKEQTSLQVLKIKAVRESPEVVLALLLDLPNLTRVEIVSAMISSDKESQCGAKQRLVEILRSSPHLKRLAFVDLPPGQIDDSQIQDLANDLSWNPSRLEELTIVSSSLGAASGKAIR